MAKLADCLKLANRLSEADNKFLSEKFEAYRKTFPNEKDAAIQATIDLLNFYINVKNDVVTQINERYAQESAKRHTQKGGTDAVQKQGTDESVLRQKESEVELPKVAGGDTIVEEAPAQSEEEIKKELRKLRTEINKAADANEIDPYKAIDVVADINESLQDPLATNQREILARAKELYNTRKENKEAKARKAAIDAEIQEQVQKEQADEDNIEFGVAKQPETAYNAKKLYSHLTTIFNKAVLDKAIKNKKLYIHENHDTIPEHVKTYFKERLGKDSYEKIKPIYGFYDKKYDAVHLIASKFNEKTTFGRVLHEVGVHAGFEAILGKNVYNNAIKRLTKTAAKLKNNEASTLYEQLVKKAVDRIPDNTPKQLVNEELLAYFIEESAAAKPNLPLWKQIISAIKQFLYRHGFFFNLNTPTGVDAIVNLAHGAAQQWMRLPSKSFEAPIRAGTEQPSPGAVDMAERMAELYKLTREKGVPKVTRVVRVGGAEEELLFTLISKKLGELLRRTKLGNKLTESTHNVWERLAVPLNETMNKNYYGRKVKEHLLEMSAIINNALANYSQKINEIAPVHIPFINQVEGYDVPEAASNAAIIMRVISDDMYGVINHDEKLRSQFADLVKSIAVNTPRTVDIESLFERIYGMPNVDKIVKLFWDTALARQPDFKNGRVRATYWRLSENNKPVPADTEIFDFKYSNEAVKIAKESYKLLTVAALERAISQHHKYNFYAEKLLDTLGNTLYLSKPGDARSALYDLVDVYYNIYASDKNKAEQFIAGIIKHMTQQEQGKDTAFKPAENDVDYKNNVELIDKLTRNLTDKQRDKLKARLEAVFQTIAAHRDESMMYMDRAVNTISQFYLAHTRLHKNRVYSRLVNKEGKPVNVDFDRYPSFVVGFETFQEAKEFVDWYNNDETAQNMWFDVIDRNNEKQQVKIVLDAVRNDYEDAVEATAPWFDVFTFTTQLERAGVNLTGAQREQLVKALANRTSKQLKAIRYRAAKGADLDIWRAYSGYLNSNAYIIANNYVGPQIDDLLAKHSWAPYEIKKEIENVKLMRDSREKELLLQELEEGLRITEKYADYATNIQDLTKKAIADYRALAGRAPGVADDVAHYAAVSYLAGNLSTAISQILSLPVSLISYLGGKNKETGFGGGYGYTQAAKEFMKALREISRFGAFTSPANLKVSFTKLLETRINNANLNPKDKLVWQYILREIKEGKLQIGQVMAVTDMYWRGLGSKHQKLNKYIELFMKPFALSEAYIRTAAWLTSFNLGWKQLTPNIQQDLIKQGVNAFNDPIFKRLVKAADETVEHTQGIYSQWARAPWLQHGWARALTMFMHYPLVQVQLLRMLPLDGALMYIALLTLLAGLDGLPLKEDIFNLVDAIVRTNPALFARFGTKALSGNIDDWYSELIDGLVNNPEMGMVVKKGLLTAMTGMDLSSKVSPGNLLRGIESGTYGDVFSLLGPIGGFFDSAITSTGNVYNALSAIALGRDPTEYLMRAARTLPVSALRNAANGLLIATEGEVRTKTGETVASNLDMWDAFHQFLGWRPVEAVQEYSLRDKQQTYKDIRANLVRMFNNELALAKAEGDYTTFIQIRKDINELNQLYAKANIPIVINVKMQYVNKIAKEMRQSLTRRAQSKLPKEIQRYFEEDIVEMEEEYGLE